MRADPFRFFSPRNMPEKTAHGKLRRRFWQIERLPTALPWDGLTARNDCHTIASVNLLTNGIQASATASSRMAAGAGFAARVTGPGASCSPSLRLSRVAAAAAKPAWQAVRVRLGYAGRAFAGTMSRTPGHVPSRYPNHSLPGAVSVHPTACRNCVQAFD